MSLTRKKNANEKNGERHELGIEVEGRLRTSDSVRHSTYMLAVEEKFICRLDAMHCPTHNSVNPIVYCIMGLVSRGPFRARGFRESTSGNSIFLLPFFFPFIIHVHVLVYVWSSDDICIRIGGPSDASASGCKEERGLAGGGPADVDPDAKRRTGGSLAPMPTTTATRRLA